MRRTLAFSLIWRLVKVNSHLLLLACLIGISYIVILRSIGTTTTVPETRSLDIDSELRSIEDQVQKNRIELAALKRNLYEVQRLTKDGKPATDIVSPDLPSSTMICLKRNPARAKTSFNIWEILQTVQFTNEDGGVWKQGWPIEYDKTQWDAENKLKVFVIPHSHNDPGWLKTYDQYYNDQTKNILTLAVNKLNEFPDMKFIWAEVSYFATWFEQQSEDVRIKVRKLIEDGKLELVTGGWVMNDEANTHYYGMIEQLILGHQWIRKNIPNAPNPKNGWAIDPFGLSPTMAYLLKESGLKHMVIQRVHYFLKKYLSQQKALEFHWRQAFDEEGQTDMFCHLMPFYSYDAPHSCGPDPSICCQFDFNRMRNSRMSCPWKIPPVKITNENVAARAEALLDQYRKKAQLYQTNSLLIPLGDDFRYDRAIEWNAQYTNYKALMDYINNNDQLNAHVQFGTLEDYFKSMDGDLRTGAATVPTLAGDFFTYADKDHDYWSGYYTSRPFYKFLDRRVESTLRTAEIVYSLAKANNMKCDMQSKLDEARRSMSLFQHHDGITGTAKTHVMKDYGQKLNGAIQNSMALIKHSVEFLLGNNKAEGCNSDYVINLNGSTEGYSSRIVLDFKQESYDLAIVNALTSYRREIVSIYTVSPDITVKGAVSQLSPVFDGCKVRNDLFELSFEVELRPLDIKVYTVTRGGQETAPLRASIVFYKSGACNNGGGGVFQVSSSDEKNVKLQTSAITASFSAYTGLLTRLTQNAAQASTEVSFWKYSTPANSKQHDRSGAYLFIPDNDAPKALRFNPSSVAVVQGSLLSEVISVTPEITTHFRVKESPGIDGQSIEIHNLVDIRQTTNFELLMRVSSSIESVTSSIHTDLNGFTFVERKYQKKLPVQANVYPMSSMVFIQDDKTRLSLASAQPLGVTSRGEPGNIYVFLDRRLNQDDNRGLAQTVTDNIPALSTFRLSIESQEEQDPRPSLLAILSYHAMTSPLLPVIVEQTSKELHSSSSTLQPCGLHLVNVRVLESEEAQFLVTLHNEDYSCSEVVPVEVCQITNAGIDLATLFGRVFGDSAQHTSLSDLHPGEAFHITENIHIPTNHIRAIKMARMLL